jgi:hypothetical protein
VLRSAACAFLLSTMPVAAVTRMATDGTERAFHDWGVAIGRGLPSPASLRPAPEVELSPDFGSDELAELELAWLSVDAAPGTKPAKHAKKGHHTARPPELSIHIDEKRLVELSRNRSIPAGRPVPAKGVRPAGIALFGVGGYGVGLKDGDVLTAVEGRSVEAEGQVVGIVMVMLARHARRISGEFWRGDRRGSIVVDVPIVQLSP